MLRLGAEEGDPLKVVNDQTGNPTSTDALAALIEQLIDNPLPGVVHGSCEGSATWYEFASKIFELCSLKRELQPCTTAEFPRPAPRPANSMLEKRVLSMAGFPPMPHWRDALERFVKKI
jgi:dTDP-4-dehydrorhamnose reductase